MEQDKLIDICSSDRLKIKALYEGFKPSFLGYGKQFGLSLDELTDIYQEAFIALRTKAVQGKLTTVKSSMKTYLFGIGKFKIYDELNRKAQKTPFTEKLSQGKEIIQEIEVFNRSNLTQEQELLKRFFVRLGEKCQEVLTLFYYRGLNIKEIVQATDYKSENVVKAQKSRCLKTLKQLCNP